MVEMGNIWDRTTEFVADHLRAILPIALLAILVPATVGNVLRGAAAACSAIDPTVSTLVSLAMMLVILWAQLALTALVLAPDAAADTAPGLAAGAPGRRALGAIGRAIAAMLLIFVALVVLAIPLVLQLRTMGLSSVGSGCAAAGPMRWGTVSWWVPVYGVALALVAMFVSVRLTMLYPVIVAEGGIVAAIRSAFRRSAGMTWRLIGVWIVFLVVDAVAAMAVTGGVGTVLRLIAPGAGPFAVTSILLAVLSAAVRTAFTVIVTVFAALLYRAVAGGGASHPGPWSQPAA